ncbi:MAG: folylpolyglutamate synthase/dihydrofolate synthase family protein [Candidatus Omnitrophota bacterium]
MIYSYKRAEDYLNSFVNYERTSFFPYKESLKLERIRLLLKGLGTPQDNLKAIHIAGTKGKGSTAAFCAGMLAAAGFKSGLYTSPHFFNFRERVRILTCCLPPTAPQTISKKDVIKIVEEIRICLEKLKISKELGKVTFFEIYTALAFKYFSDKKTDFAVIETGLGGCLDATNVLTPRVSVITHIGYDHQDKLGNKLGDIAYEKAGIIKQGVPLVCSCQRPAVLKIIKSQCKEKKSTSIFLFGKDFLAENIRLKQNHTVFDFTFGTIQLKNLKIKLRGKHQVENAACAIAAVSLLKKQELSPNIIKKGFVNCEVEGRFEIAGKNPLIVLDVAHNISSFSVLAKSLKSYFPGKKVILIFACSRDKDAKKMLKQISYDKLILTQFNSPRCLEAEQVKKNCGLKETAITSNIKEAFQAANKVYNKGSVIVVSGSLFLVSEAKTALV